MSTGVFTDIRSLHGLGLINVEHDKGRAHLNQFITCGMDGTIYVWDERTFTADKSTAEVKNVGEQTYAVAVWRGNNVYFGYLQLDLISGVEKKRVGTSTFNNLEEVTPLMTFNLEPTSIDVSDTFLACGTSEFTIKLMKLAGKVDLATVDVSGEVLCVKIDPKEEYLAAAISDGSVVIYDLKNSTTEEVPEVAKISHAFPSINTISVEFPREELIWSPDGEFIYVPYTGSIKIIPRDIWKPLPDGLRAPGRELDPFSICTISSNGKILAACTVNRHICFWNTSDLKFINQYEYKRNCPGKTFITSIDFASFDERSIIVADSNEGMCLLKNAVSSLDFNAEGNKATDTIRNKDRKRILDSDDEDEDKRPIDVFLDDAADEDTNLSEDIGAIKKQYGFANQSTLDDFFGPEGDERAPTDFRNLDAMSSGPIVQKVTQVIEYVPSTIPAHFTSGASPKNLSSRYLKWNTFGTIRSIREDDVNNIEIEYHDKDVHSEMIFENTANYSIGDLTDEAIALANVAEGEEEQSELWVYHVTAWDGANRKWTTNLPVNDHPIDILVSQKLIGVLTIQRNLRVFTLQGTQRHIIAHPGPTLTACCFDTKFAIISFTGSEYYENAGKDNAQYNYTASIYNLDPKLWYHTESNVSIANIAVKPRETITWVGYTNSGKLCVIDSSYSVRLLTRGGFWLPIFDGDSIPRSKSDALWPISVIDGTLKQFRYLYCRGSKYPMMALKLAPTIVPWTLPLCHAESDKTKYEQEIFFNELDQNEAIFTGADINRLVGQHLQCIVHLFALACKMGRDTRAWELAHLVPSAKGIQGLVNFANKTGRTVLGEKVAAYGRDNMSAGDATTSHKPYQIQEEFLGPKQVMMSRRSIRETTQQDIFDDSERNSMPLSRFTHSQTTDTSLLLDTSLNSSINQQTTRNPFKRAVGSSQNESSQSLFDKLEESFDNPRKRAREEMATKPPTVKQSKLDFGRGKENKINYQDWLEDNEERLKKTFSGDVSDFDKFCIGQFRLFSTSQKKKRDE